MVRIEHNEGVDDTQPISCDYILCIPIDLVLKHVYAFVFLQRIVIFVLPLKQSSINDERYLVEKKKTQGEEQSLFGMPAIT